ncbi:hypothetical protein EIP91_001165 [Steccherinum ochraceum]|uniref:Major facilitator superfamily (MFS) profile domain-containing protein n=1 Tax=Steccherinum ochraceum TaxID=92696 RepID=A0A4V2MXN5_9APHY|nr:hypothetical protein EIP91_001165 [Steccherinum ochraceum]
MEPSAIAEKRELERRQQHIDEESASQSFAKSDHAAPQTGLAKGIMLTACCTLSLMIVSMTASSVAIGLSTTERDLNIPEDQLQWMLSAYALSSGCLLIPFGRLADLYGRRNIFLIGCLFQGAFSLGCGFGNDLITIAVLRGFQGLGGAATIPACLGILAHAFPPGNARSLAFATFSAGQPMGGAIGFLLGGALSQVTSTSWRTMYWVVAGLSAVCIVMALIFVDRDGPSTEVDRRVDWLGAFLITAGLVLIVFVLSDGELAPNQWSTPYIIGLLVAGVIFVLLFLAWQYYLERPEVRKNYSIWTPPPLMKLSLWKRGKGRFAAIQLVIFCLMAGFQSWILWIVLYYQNYERLNPVLTMIRMIPMFPAGVICNIIIALVVAHVDGMHLIAFGCTCSSVAGILLAVINPNAPYWAFGFPSSILIVIGADFVFAGGTLFVAKLSLPHEQSLAGGLYQTMAMLGQAFGLAITTIVFDRVRATQSAKLGVTIDRDGLDAPLPAQLKAYRATSWTIVGFTLFAAVLAVLFLRGVGVLGGPHTPPEQDPQEVTAIDKEHEAKGQTKSDSPQ